MNPIVIRQKLTSENLEEVFTNNQRLLKVQD